MVRSHSATPTWSKVAFRSATVARLSRSERRQRRRRPGITLLELLLALALTVIVMAAIGMAINLHMKTLHSRRLNVEEAQLARQVLRRIADDLRGAVQYQVIDFSSIESLAKNSASAAANTALEESGMMSDGSTDDTGLDASLLAGLVEEEEPLDIASTAAPPSIPGLYGNQYELQIDVSRLPRVEEYQVMLNPLSGETVADIPSDVKTVAYYLQPDLAATSTTSTLNDPTTSERVRATGAIGRGLVRRELDRAVSLWAAENNNLEDLATQGEMLAMEVTGLEFRYFDGTEWLLEWNSEERQGLPVAVAIAVEISRNASAEEALAPRSLLDPVAAAAADAEQQSSRLLYRLVVHLPSAEPTSADTARFPETTQEDTTGTITTPASDSGDDPSGDQGTGGAGTGSGGAGGGGSQSGGGNDDDTRSSGGGGRRGGGR